MKVFVAGARAITNLDDNVTQRLSNMIMNNISILVGDANGVDKAVQQFFYKDEYTDVVVYAMKGKPRNNIGNWRVMDIYPIGNTTGFDYYATKDLKMAEDADYGFMIWNGKSKGTLNNIVTLIIQNKKTLVYFVPERRFYTISNFSNLDNLIEKCDATINDSVNKLKSKHAQITMF